MSTGGGFGADDIAYFNGDLFTDAEVLELSVADLDTLARVSALDWSSIQPAIFGTLFERSLDPDKRSQLGAHYTSREDILLVVEPVLMIRCGGAGLRLGLVRRLLPTPLRLERLVGGSSKTT